MANKRKYLIWLMLLVAVSAGGFWGVKVYQNHKETALKEKYRQYVEYSGKEKISDYQLLEGQSVLVAKWKTETAEENALMEKYGRSSVTGYTTGNKATRMISPDYVIRENVKIKKNIREFHSQSYDSDEYWTVSVYQVKGKQLHYFEIDIPEVVTTYDSNLYPRLTESTTEGGNTYLLIYTSDKENYLDSVALWYNLETREIEKANDADKKNWDFVFSSSLHDKLKKDGIVYQTEAITLKKSYDGAKSELYSRYPAAYQLLKGENTLDEQHAMYILSSRETDNIALKVKALELLYPKGTNLFANTMIPSENSTDGKEHMVNSYEEFLQYYKGDN